MKYDIEKALKLNIWVNGAFNFFAFWLKRLIDSQKLLLPFLIGRLIQL